MTLWLEWVLFSFPYAVSELKPITFFFSLLIPFEREPDSVMYRQLQVRIDPGFVEPEVYAVWRGGCEENLSYSCKFHKNMAKAPPGLRAVEGVGV